MTNSRHRADGGVHRRQSQDLVNRGEGVSRPFGGAGGMLRGERFWKCI